MRLFIPSIGDTVTLERDWKFRLFAERRNEALIKATGINEESVSCLCNWGQIEYNRFQEISKNVEPKGWQYTPINVSSPLHHGWGVAFTRFTLPEGAQLNIDRLYIRRGQKDFNSITFLLKRESVLDTDFYKNLPKGKLRFWAKLQDCNNMIIVPPDIRKE